MQYVGLGLHDILAYQNWTDWENPRGVILWIVELGRPLSSPPNPPLRLEAKEGRRLLGMKVIAGLEGFTVQQSNSTQMSYCGLCDWVHIQNSLGTNWKARRERVPKICLEGVRKDIKVFLSFKSYLFYDCFMRQDLIIQPTTINLPASASHTLSDHRCVHPTLKSHSDCIFSSQIK